MKPAAFSTVTKVGHLATTARDITARRTPAVCRLRRHTLRVERASDAGNDVGAGVPMEALDPAIAEFREKSGSIG